MPCQRWQTPRVREEEGARIPQEATVVNCPSHPQILEVRHTNSLLRILKGRNARKNDNW